MARLPQSRLDTAATFGALLEQSGYKKDGQADKTRLLSVDDWLRIAWLESKFRTDAKSQTGVRGIIQTTRRTYSDTMLALAIDDPSNALKVLGNAGWTVAELRSHSSLERFSRQQPNDDEAFIQAFARHEKSTKQRDKNPSNWKPLWPSDIRSDLRKPSHFEQLSNQAIFALQSEREAREDLNNRANSRGFEIKAENWPLYIYTYHNIGPKAAREIMTAVESGNGNKTLDTLGISTKALNPNHGLTRQGRRGPYVSAQQYLNNVEKHFNRAEPDVAAALKRPVSKDRLAAASTPSSDQPNWFQRRWEDTQDVASKGWEKAKEYKGVGWLAGGGLVGLLLSGLFTTSEEDSAKSWGWNSLVSLVGVAIGMAAVLFLGSKTEPITKLRENVGMKPDPLIDLGKNSLNVDNIERAMRAWDKCKSKDVKCSDFKEELSDLVTQNVPAAKELQRKAAAARSAG